MLGVALGVVLMPQLAAARAAQDDARYSAMLDWGLRLVVLLAVPCAVALLVFARPLVAVLYHYGAFSAGRRAAQVTSALAGYGVGLVGLVAIKVLAPGFYARHDMRTPMRIAVGVLVLTQLLNLVLVPVLQHAALTLTIGLGALVNAAVAAGRPDAPRQLPARCRAGACSLLQVVAGARRCWALLLWWAAGYFDWTGIARAAAAARRPAGRVRWRCRAAVLRRAAGQRAAAAQFCRSAEVGTRRGRCRSAGLP